MLAWRPSCLLPWVHCVFVAACGGNASGAPALAAATLAPGEAPVALGDSQGKLRTLDLPGFEPAILFTPAGDDMRPLVMAAHGAGGDPELECDYWRKLTQGHAFILCLRGTPLHGANSGYFYRDHRALNRELVAAEQAARAVEPRIAKGSGVYAGFSQGASMGALILHEHANEFPYAVLIEGFTSFNVPLGRRFLQNGGKRILFVCGSKQCASVASSSVRWLTLAGAQARLEVAASAGHTPAGPVMQGVADALPWLLDGDPSW